MIERRLWSQLSKYLPKPEAIVITGPRQVGKTTTLYWLLEQVTSSNKAYFDLENANTRNYFAQANYENILRFLTAHGLDLTKPMYVALDEIQFLPNITSVVKYLYDHYQIKFFLSGSSSFYLKHHFTQSLAGRKFLFELLPLDFSEYLQFKGLSKQKALASLSEAKYDPVSFDLFYGHYHEYVNWGGLPKVVLAGSSEEKHKILEGIYSAYINIDIAYLADFRKKDELDVLIKLLAARVGSKLDVAKLAKISGLSRPTIYSYLQFLEDTYIIRRVGAYSKSADVRNRLPEKVYFVDTGIAKLNADLAAGAKFENTVAAQLTHLGQITYYQTKTQTEIDFILGGKIALEVKETPIDTDYNALTRRVQELGLKEYYLIGRRPSATFSDFLWGGKLSLVIE